MWLGKLLKDLIPALWVLAAVIISAVPWGLPASTSFVLPLATAMLVFLFASRPEARLAPWFVFLAGLITDMLTAGPLGYWALIFLVAYALGRNIAPSGARRGLLGLLQIYMLTAAATAAMAWGVASVYYVRLIDWRPMVFACLAAVALFPLLVRLSGYRRRAGLWAGD